MFKPTCYRGSLHVGYEDFLDRTERMCLDGSDFFSKKNDRKTTMARLLGPINGKSTLFNCRSPISKGLATPAVRATAAMDSTAAETSSHVLVKTWNKTLTIHINGMVHVEDNLRNQMEIWDTRRAAAPYDTKPTTHTKTPRKHCTLFDANEQ